MGSGFSFQVFPAGEKGFIAVELAVLRSNLSIKNDIHNLAGDSMMSGCYSRFRSIKMETEANTGNLLHFETFDALNSWLKTKCNILWPCCNYCGRRYVEDEVVCSGCGGPRGEETN